jgi:hypothetical protein
VSAGPDLRGGRGATLIGWGRATKSQICGESYHYYYYFEKYLFLGLYSLSGRLCYFVHFTIL